MYTEVCGVHHVFGSGKYQHGGKENTSDLPLYMCQWPTLVKRRFSLSATTGTRMKGPQCFFLWLGILCMILLPECALGFSGFALIEFHTPFIDNKEVI
jgi:hypothetical protein